MHHADKGHGVLKQYAALKGLTDQGEVDRESQHVQPLVILLSSTQGGARRQGLV